jgi:hypothetical protein
MMDHRTPPALDEVAVVPGVLVDMARLPHWSILVCYEFQKAKIHVNQKIIKHKRNPNKIEILSNRIFHL